MAKYEWRKKEKSIYLPKNKPEVIDIPEFQFVTIAGKGNPNHPDFGDYIGVLYSLSYAIKMNLKKDNRQIKNYTDYTVYPLEGVWDITDEAKKTFTGSINKDDLVFTIMIRQPDFVTDDFYEEMFELLSKKKPHKLLQKVKFEKIKEGKCVQMLHFGPYDDEPASFAMMETYAKSEGLKRHSKIHREIYLNDFRKVAQEKLKTVLRFKVDS